MEPRALLVLTTCGDDAAADALATALVEERLAACVNRVAGVASTYRWRGKIERERECLLLIKTTSARLPAVERAAAILRAMGALRPQSDDGSGGGQSGDLST